MDQQKQERFKAFLAALEASGQEMGGGEIACHHSAVEVNDWVKIRKAMLDANPDCPDSQAGKINSDS